LTVIKQAKKIRPEKWVGQWQRASAKQSIVKNEKAKLAKTNKKYQSQVV